MKTNDSYTFKHAGHQIRIDVHTGWDDFPFWDAYCDGKWLTCSQEDELDIEGKAISAIDAMAKRG